MSIFKAFIEGIKQVNSNKKMLFTLFICNLLFALLIAAPLYFFLSSTLSRSLMADNLIQKFDIQFLIELIPQHLDALRPFAGLILVAALGFFVLSSFLAGGIIAFFHYQGKNSFFRQFFQGCGAYFTRFLRLMLISLIFYCIAFIIFLIVQLITGAIFAETPLTFIIPGIILIFLMLFINMLFDYAKIKTVVEDRKGMFRAVFNAIKFIFLHLKRAMGLYYFIVIAALVLTIILVSIKNLIPSINWGLIILLFIWQQFIVIARLWLRMLFFSSQLQLYKAAAK